MKPVDQTTFGHGHGNCLSACIASILELDLADVPCWHTGSWYLKWSAWLARKGFNLMSIRSTGDIQIELDSLAFMSEGHYIVSGLSPRAGKDGNSEKMLHAVVYQAGQLVHDPHPSREGVKDIRAIEIIVPCETPTGHMEAIIDMCTCVEKPTPMVDSTCPKHGVTS